jgi:hypothetical protein
MYIVVGMEIATAPYLIRVNNITMLLGLQREEQAGETKAQGAMSGTC